MDFELLLVAVTLAAGLGLLLWVGRRRGRTVVAGAVAVVVSGLVLWGGVRYRRPRLEAERTPVTDRPIEVPDNGYVSSDTCRACHPHYYDSWNHSHHRRMTQLPSTESIVADFEDVTLEHAGHTYDLGHDGDTYWVEMDQPHWDGLGDYESPPRQRREIKLVSGSHHAQVFWFSSGVSRRLDLFPFAFRIAERRWIPLDAAFLVPPGETQLTETARWNSGCTKCHTVNTRPRIFSPTEIDTQASEFGIACEACHGPGEEHIRRHRDPLSRYGLHLSGDADDTMVNPPDLASDRQSMVCGQCHAVNELRHAEAQGEYLIDGLQYRPGDDLLETRVMRRDVPYKFWPDGMLRLTGREYTSLIVNPCYVHADPERGVMSCFSCHQVHYPKEDERAPKVWADDMLKQGMRGNLACTQCHEQYEDQAVLTDHTHHEADSSGSNCYNCHMPKTSYGLLTAIRSHQISNPDIGETLATHRPNACNLCHLDKSLGWTGEYMQSWYDRPTLAEAATAQGLGERIQQDFEEIAASVMWILRGDATVRALYAWHMGWKPAQEISGTKWMAPFLAHTLIDPYHAVRYIADRSLRTLSGYRKFDYDFLDPQPQRMQAFGRILQRWSNNPAKDERLPDAALLVGEDGKLDQKTVQRLFTAQDQRPVYLTE